MVTDTAGLIQQALFQSRHNPTSVSIGVSGPARDFAARAPATQTEPEVLIDFADFDAGRFHIRRGPVGLT